MVDRPLITAEITFLRTDEGGRVQAPTFKASGRYMPHLVVQGRDIRKAIVDTDRFIRERYQGVAFVSGPEEFKLGDTATFVLELMYYPKHQYEDVIPGATFTLREGARIIGHGCVLSRSGPVAE